MRILKGHFYHIEESSSTLPSGHEVYSKKALWLSTTAHFCRHDADFMVPLPYPLPHLLPPGSPPCSPATPWCFVTGQALAGRGPGWLGKACLTADIPKGLLVQGLLPKVFPSATSYQIWYPSWYHICVSCCDRSSVLLHYWGLGWGPSLISL